MDDAPVSLNHPLHAQILAEIDSRSTWEERQATWYQMRHDGLRRRVKPFPGAADLHLPIADTIISKWKPFYGQQIYATELLASFVAKKPELADYTSDLEKWFDYQIKFRSNFSRQITVANDKMLTAGFGVVKTTWDVARERLRFASVEPAKLIVPWHTEELSEADWLVHVLDVSVAQYKTTEGYDHDPEFIRRIRGSGLEDDAAAQAKARREGVTHSTSNDIITLWEVWERIGNTYEVTTYSPLDPARPVKATTQHPYQHGRLPFVRIDHEVKGNGHYDSRGITEQVAPFETYGTKVWNEKTDFLSFVNRPLFQAAPGIANPGNLRLKPGSVLPHGITLAQMPSAPASFDVEMGAARGMAEYRAGMPDFGMGKSTTTSEPRTAREVGALVAFSQAGITDKGMSFREPVREIYEQGFLLLVEFGSNQLEYAAGKTWATLPKQALANGYCVRPNGSADSWDRQSRLQKAVVRQQTFANSPFIDQYELTKSVLELDDPQLAPKLLVDPGAKAADEYEAEAMLLPTILLGLPLQLKPDMDPQPRLKCLVDFIQSRAQLGEPATELQKKAVGARVQALLGLLAERDPAAAQQAAAGIQQMVAQTSQQATQSNMGGGDAPVATQ
jgi:hypothetical protein